MLDVIGFSGSSQTVFKGITVKPWLKPFEGEAPMFSNLGIFKMSAAMAAHAGRRQALVAQNMANVDTPGYRAIRLQPFSMMVEAQGQQNTLRATRPGHMHGSGSENARAPTTEDKSATSPNGNSVSVEREMLQAVEVRREHDRALAIYKSALKILHANLARA